MLITFLQKGLAYVGIEEHLNEVTDSRCGAYLGSVGCVVHPHRPEYLLVTLNTSRMRWP